MKIYYEQSGGFMGRTSTLTIDTSEIPPQIALRLLQILEEVNFVEWSEAPSGQSLESMSEPDSPPIHRDEMCYRITVEIAGTHHTISTTDTTAPHDLEPLLQELNNIARQSRRPGRTD